MTIEGQITILEKRHQNYKNNYGIAVQQNSKIRQTKYANLTAKVKLEIKQLERDIPLESNERLREIIEEQNKKIAIQQEVRNKQGEKIKELEQSIKQKT